MKEKTVSKAIEHRRSVRIYDPKKAINTAIVKQCIQQAILAPSSSNLQLWEFYHIISKTLLEKISESCFNQPAAKTANQLVIPIVRLDLWPKRIQSNVGFIKNVVPSKISKKSKKEALGYYQKVLPKLYKGTNKLRGFFGKIMMQYRGISKITYREVSSTDLRVIGHKSTALAAQNFMTSMAAFDYDTCPMEGFDSVRLKNILELPKEAQISMVIGCGIRKEEGVYGDRFRVPFEEVYFQK
jgi:nitroreductase